MAKMRAVDAAVQVLLKEGVTAAFGVPGAAINPLYSAMEKAGGIDHVLARRGGKPGVDLRRLAVGDGVADDGVAIGHGANLQGADDSRPV